MCCVLLHSCRGQVTLTQRGCGLESDTAGGQENRTKWWPLLSDGAWQPLDGGCAAWIMLNYTWQGAERKPYGWRRNIGINGGAWPAAIQKESMNAEVLHIIRWVGCGLDDLHGRAQHVTRSHRLICSLLFSAELLPLGDLPLSNALWQKKPVLWINQSRHFLCFEG